MSTEQCIFCNEQTLNGPNFVADFGNWVLLANQYQYLLGVCMLIHREHKEGLSSLSNNEAAEAHAILGRVETALKKPFDPDWFNYLQTNNSVRHLHFHIIPRYQSPVFLDEEEFVDENFNGMPIERERRLPDDSMKKMINLIRSNL